MRARLRQFDRLIKKHSLLVLFLFVVILLRLPNFFEPYWYGDEGIYLVLGQSLRFGRMLYAQIIDHKTPLIYYFAMTSNQLWFRILLLGWMMVTTMAFYHLSLALFRKKLPIIVANLVFIFLTTLPWLEGNIPNGELFVMGFVLVAAWLLLKTRYFAIFKHTDEPVPAALPLAPFKLLAAGALLGLGILTKVPGLFDMVAILSIAWLTMTRSFITHLKRFDLKKMLAPVPAAILIVIGVILPILASIVYFVARGSGQAYLDFGLLYNFRYAGSWGLPFDQAWLLFLFTLPGKTLVLAVLGVAITLAGRWLRPAVQFSALWFILALFASLLSNRPYPHYYLQLIPPLALFAGAWLDVCLHKVPHESRAHYLWEKLMTSALGVTLGGLLVAVFLLLQVYFYPTVSYYENWWRLISGQMSLHDYRQSFNSVMADNYAAAEIIKPCPDPYLFIWGTNPMLYALTGKIPSGRFTVAFHIKDFNAYDETLAAVEETAPTFIVVMNDDANTFPAFNEYLHANYMPNTTFTHFTLWRRL